MTRKLIHCLAAILILVTATLTLGQPAQAAPGGACSMEEWRQPGNFKSCVGRLGTATEKAVGCIGAPNPGSPTEGEAGWVASRPDSSMRSGIQGQFSMYGVGGYGLDTYDLGCLGTLEHPDVVATTTFASWSFTGSAAILGAANVLRERAYDPGAMWSWADPFIKQATASIFKYVFNTIGVIIIALSGLFLLWQSRQGNLSQATKVISWALFVVVGVTGIAKWPVQSAHGFDRAGTVGLTLVQTHLGPAPENITDAHCPLEGDSCLDHRTVATRASDLVTEDILYRNWVRAVLGNADSKTAKKYGHALYDATAMTWDEASRADQSAALRQQLIDWKGQQFDKIAAQIRTEDPQAYEYLQGLHGQDRVFAGLSTFFSTALFAMFDMSASIIILVGFVLARLAIILAPLLGTLGLFYYTSSGLHRVFHMVTGALANIFVFGAASGLYLSAVAIIFGTASIPPLLQILLVGLVGVGLMLFLRPVRQLVNMSRGRSRSDSDGLTARLFRAGQAARAGSTPAATPGDTTTTGPRPETAAAAPRAGNTPEPAAGPQAAPAAAPRPESAGPARHPGTGPARPRGFDRQTETSRAAVKPPPSPSPAMAATGSNPTPRPENRS